MHAFRGRFTTMTFFTSLKRQFSRSNWVNLIPNIITGIGAVVTMCFFVIALVSQNPVFATLVSQEQQVSTALTVIVGLTSATVILQVTYHITTLFPIKESLDKLGQSEVFVGTSELYGQASRERISYGKYKSLEVYAPTALWVRNEHKRLWLETVLKEASGGMEVRFVFGLPTNKERWQVMKALLQELFQDTVNVRVAYQPPMRNHPTEQDHPDTALGVAIAITDERDRVGSWILFAFASSYSEFLTDTGVAHTNGDAVDRGQVWFQQKVWEPCQNIRMLYDPSKNITVTDAVRKIEQDYPYLA